MNIPERQREELLLFHQQFLASPIASSIRSMLGNHEANIVDFLASRAMDTSGTTDQQFRQYAVQLAETRKIAKAILDPETFLNKTTNER